METTAAQAIEELILDYSKLVFHVIYGMTGHWEESQDLTQETFLSAFRGVEAARAKAGVQFQPKAWLLKVAINTVRMAQRRQRGLRFVSFADLPSQHEGLEQVTEYPPASEEFEEAGNMEAAIAERDVVNRCLRKLPETLCTPLLLSIVAGFSSGEIAGLLDMKEATVRQRLARARKSFQRLYAHECGEPILIKKSVPRSRTHAILARGRLGRQPAALASVAL